MITSAFIYILDIHWIWPLRGSHGSQDQGRRPRYSHGAGAAGNSGKPHFRRVEGNLAIGYRRLRGRSGTWTARHYVGDGNYAFDIIGTADDRSPADGIEVLSFDQAVAKARELHLDRAKQAAGIHAPLTVEAAMDAYVKHLDQNGKNVDQIERTFAKYVIPLLGQKNVADLTSEMLTEWKAKVAAMPAKGRRPFDPRARKSRPMGRSAN